VKKLAVAVCVVLLVALLAGCETTNKTKVQKAAVPRTYNLIVDVRLSGAANVRGDISSCIGAGRFADIAPMAKVVVTDQNAKPIALGGIAYGIGTDYYRDVLDECSFRIFVTGVPKAKQYAIVVGRQRPVPFTRKGLIETNGVFGYDLNAPNVPYPVLPTTTTTKG
jgi:hypothetical protein